ncbi:kinase-like protein [Hesseltinella vesiculosa]|uniref:Kinase-like protein n=1 Tax=Hesseltinella vesiculosa TaxID=101127 RepID=A0A1X2GSP8_9FUNG|nr:kinase-like protein [Hesseltinella vesiculosa]
MNGPKSATFPIQRSALGVGPTPQPSLSSSLKSPLLPRAAPIPEEARSGAFRKVSDSINYYPTASPSSNQLNLLTCLTKGLNHTYQKCNHGFQYNSTKNPRRVLTKPSKPCGNDGYDNEDFDYILKVNDTLGSTEGHRYVILDVLGAGTFGQVVKCKHVKTQEVFAIKVVKNKLAYFKQSMMEVTILEMLNQRYDPNDQHHILRLKDTFIHRQHLCLVFELMSVNLYELIKQNHFRGLSTNLVRVLTTQMLDALTVLNEARIIHCDLKPENVLLRTLESPSIKVIDFGSACHELQTMYTYIQSRFYRSPEVLVGLPYTSAIDMWSLGCITAELFLGLPLFPGSSEYNQISRIVEMMGLPPAYMIEMGKHSHRYFERQVDDHGHKHYRLRSLEQYAAEQGKQEQPSKRYFSATTLPDLINTYPVFRKDSMTSKELEKEKQHRLAMIDFLQGLLNLNHFERWSPQQAKQHPFITGEPFTGPFKPPFIPRSQSSAKLPPPVPAQFPEHDPASSTELKQRQRQSMLATLLSASASASPPQEVPPPMPTTSLTFVSHLPAQEACDYPPPPIQPASYLHPAYSSLPNHYSHPPHLPPDFFVQGHDDHRLVPVLHPSIPGSAAPAAMASTSAPYHPMDLPAAALLDPHLSAFYPPPTSSSSSPLEPVLSAVIHPPLQPFPPVGGYPSHQLPLENTVDHPRQVAAATPHSTTPPSSPSSTTTSATKSTVTTAGRPRANTVGTMLIPPPIQVATLDAVSSNKERTTLGETSRLERDSPPKFPQPVPASRHPPQLQHKPASILAVPLNPLPVNSTHLPFATQPPTAPLNNKRHSNLAYPTTYLSSPINKQSQPIDIKRASYTAGQSDIPSSHHHSLQLAHQHHRSMESLVPTSTAAPPLPMHHVAPPLPAHPAHTHVAPGCPPLPRQPLSTMPTRQHRRHASTWRASLGHMPTLDLERDADWTEDCSNSPPAVSPLPILAGPAVHDHPQRLSSSTSSSLAMSEQHLYPQNTSPLSAMANMSLHRSSSTSANPRQHHRRSHSSGRFSEIVAPPSPSLMSRVGNVASLHRRVRGHPPLVQPYHRQDLEWDGFHPASTSTAHQQVPFNVHLE